MLDVFNTNAFGLIRMTRSLLRLPMAPTRLQQMGIFADEGITTAAVALEELNGQIALLASQRRGEPAQQAKHEKRKLRSITVPHFPYEDTILASALSGVRQFGSENAAQDVASVVNNRMQKMKNDHSITLEYMRAGTLQGLVRDVNGTLFNLFTEFDVSEQTQDFVFGTSTTPIREKVLDAKQKVEDKMGGLAYDHIHCLCGYTWFRKFISHADVVTAWSRYQDGARLRDDPRAGFEFAGVTFEEYRGSVSSKDFFPATETRFFPVGSPGLFTTYYAPAEFVETVNTIGIPMYAKQELLPMGTGIKVHVQSNPLALCHRPEILVKGYTSN